MKIGVRGHDYGRHGVAEYAALLHDEGYDTVQLAVPKAITGVNGFDEITPALLAGINEEFAKQKVEIGIFSCYMDLSNPDSEVRRKAVETFCRGLSCAKEAGAKMAGTETSYEHLGPLEKQRRFPYMMDSLKRITEEAERLSVQIGLEPVAFHPLEDMERPWRFWMRLGVSGCSLFLTRQTSCSARRRFGRRHTGSVALPLAESG